MRARKARTANPAKKGSRKQKSRPEKPVSIPEDVQRQFKLGVMARGEAAVAKDGELPPGATHEIVGTDEKGEPLIRRRRFSLA